MQSTNESLIKDSQSCRSRSLMSSVSRLDREAIKGLGSLGSFLVRVKEGGCQGPIKKTPKKVVCGRGRVVHGRDGI